MKLRLLTEWIYAEDRDSELYDQIRKIRFQLLNQSSLDGLAEILDALESLVYKIPVDDGDKKQRQKDLLQNLLQHISAAKKTTNPHLIFQIAKDLDSLILPLLRDARADSDDH